MPDFDSKLDERFARSFARLTSQWEVVREPTAFAAGGSLIFPDFELRHRWTGASWLLEIVGYWTAEYLLALLEPSTCSCSSTDARVRATQKT